MQICSHLLIVKLNIYVLDGDVEDLELTSGQILIDIDGPKSIQMSILLVVNCR